MISPIPTASKKSEPSFSRLRREAKKKALLIGINSLRSPSVDYGLLQGPHQDVAQMKNLLAQKYGYRDEDIMVLIDDGILGHVQPDRRNIMLSIQTLVTDTHEGDKLFFHYCGHTIQVPSRSNTEEDGLDECLVPLDGEERMITDNELRAQLVDTLPVGASLVAVFDSCHSASLLDLEHLRCNRVFVPWMSKGKRKSDEMRNRMVRRLAMPMESPSCATRSRTIYQSSRASPTRVRSRCTPIDTVYSPMLSPRPSPRSPLNGFMPAPWDSPTTSPENETVPGRLARRVSLSSARPASRKSRVPAPLKLWESNKENLHVDSGSALATGGDSQSWYTPDSLVHSALPSTTAFCESPEAAYCHGWCRAADDNGLLPGAKDPSRELADVISLGACKDSELSWENEDGMSMTRALIQVLNDDPHPTLRELVTQISHTLHGLTRKRHLEAKVWKNYRNAHGIKSSGIGSFDTETFQHPQISSHRPLKMDARWSI
ncbi:peptidase C14, caspase domain-containing protein [Mycena rosella]|uniref:Peptidase C14, caspase domain-containing protein n=1 Tax=Mycena rosella TaxID=1033263 RepID=A0AAD7CZP8_MYCRO|nr:peptidase C14, caspase domain-containing protein [Mycena rosella]